MGVAICMSLMHPPGEICGKGPSRPGQGICCWQNVRIADPAANEHGSRLFDLSSCGVQCQTGPLTDFARCVRSVHDGDFGGGALLVAFWLNEDHTWTNLMIFAYFCFSLVAGGPPARASSSGLRQEEARGTKGASWPPTNDIPSSYYLNHVDEIEIWPGDLSRQHWKIRSPI